jgi:ABC-2 type transport system ATP-binding protein
LRGVALDARIDRLLTRVDLLDAADRPLRGYSKGMLQRVGLAQALLNEPKLVFLDEPTSGLDPLGRLLVRGIIDELRSDGVTVFLNSHLLGEVEATCDRVAFVKRGRVISERSLSARADALDLELRLASVAPEIAEGLSRFGTNILSPRPDVITMRTESEAMVPAIVRWLVEQNVQIHGVQPRRRSLEEVFLDVMGDDERPG